MHACNLFMVSLNFPCDNMRMKYSDVDYYMHDNIVMLSRYNFYVNIVTLWLVNYSGT